MYIVNKKLLLVLVLDTCPFSNHKYRSRKLWRKINNIGSQNEKILTKQPFRLILLTCLLKDFLQGKLRAVYFSNLNFILFNGRETVLVCFVCFFCVCVHLWICCVWETLGFLYRVCFPENDNDGDLRIFWCASLQEVNFYPNV